MELEKEGQIEGRAMNESNSESNSESNPEGLSGENKIKEVEEEVKRDEEELKKVEEDYEKSRDEKIKEVEERIKEDEREVERDGEYGEEDLEDCIFCKIVNGEVESEKVFEDKNFIAFLDINPKVKNHIVLIPRKHYRTILDMPNTLGNEMIESIKKISLDLINQKKAEGFNLWMNNFEVSGQVVPHAHIHILPRNSGDGFKVVL